MKEKNGERGTTRPVRATSRKKKTCEQTHAEEKPNTFTDAAVRSFLAVGRWKVMTPKRVEEESRMHKDSLKLGRLGTVLVLILAVSSFAAAGTDRFTRTEKEIEIPGVTLVNQDGDLVDFQTLVQGDKPVYLEFVFATCTTICPIMSAGFSSMQRKLGPKSHEVELISITIDPEHDSPDILAKYLLRYKAKPGWSFLTGSREDIDLVMKSFDAYVADKMSHRPLTFVRQPADGKWVMLSGFPNTSDLMAEMDMEATR